MVAANSKRPMLNVNLAQIAGQERLAGYLLITNFLDEQAIVSASLGGIRPAKAIVYLIIVAATVQKHMRGVEVKEVIGTTWFPEDKCGYISRRAVAEASGLPRENVRRIINELMADGRVEQHPDNMLVRQSHGLIADTATIAGVERLAERVAIAAQRLLDIGVLTLRDESA